VSRRSLAETLRRGLVRSFVLLCGMRSALRAQVGTVVGASLLCTPPLATRSARLSRPLLTGPRILAGQGAVGPFALPQVRAVRGG
jgi:hypothetical protein